MPSPFPGIDPYLESQDYWQDFHARFIPYCCDFLADRMPEHYVAQIDARVHLVNYSEEATKQILPDLAILREETTPPRDLGAPMATLTLDPVTIPLMTGVVEEVRDRWIEIRRLSDRSLVTVIEVLSPSNKVGSGRRDYLEKRLDLIRRPVHLVELDLLAGGHRLPMRRPLPPGHYYALVSRAERRPDCDVYAWTIRQPAPTIPIPLAAPDHDVPLGLAQVFNLAYERGRYARSIKYGAPLTVPLGLEDRAWAEERARLAVH